MVLISLVLDEITASFRRFGHLFVDWPHKAESKSYFPPKGKFKPADPHNMCLNFYIRLMYLCV